MLLLLLVLSVRGPISSPVVPTISGPFTDLLRGLGTRPAAVVAVAMRVLLGPLRGQLILFVRSLLLAGGGLKEAMVKLEE